MHFNYKELLKTARQARENSYSPYSNFKVGAAILSKSGNVYSGCNVENAAFSPSCCAERVAIFKAISEKESNFVAIAVVGGKECATHLLPCGVCLQVLSEFCAHDFIVVTGDDENYKCYTLNQLLPNAFSKRDS